MSNETINGEWNEVFVFSDDSGKSETVKGLLHDLNTKYIINPSDMCYPTSFSVVKLAMMKELEEFGMMRKILFQNLDKPAGVDDDIEGIQSVQSFLEKYNTRKRNIWMELNPNRTPNELSFGPEEKIVIFSIQYFKYFEFVKLNLPPFFNDILPTLKELSTKEKKRKRDQSDTSGGAGDKVAKADRLAVSGRVAGVQSVADVGSGVHSGSAGGGAGVQSVADVGSGVDSGSAGVQPVRKVGSGVHSGSGAARVASAPSTVSSAAPAEIQAAVGGADRK